MRRLCLAALVVLLPIAPACLSEPDKGDEEELPDELGKDDSFQRPTDHGSISFGDKAASALTDTERHHTWTFELSGDAQLDLRTTYAVRGQRKTDTVLYLYKEGPTGWGPYIARNDDADRDTVYSRITRSLGAGRYRALVKGYLASTRGKFALTIACEGAGCAPPPVAGGCVFGETYHDLAGNPALQLHNRSKITAANLATLNPIDQQRLVVAVQQSSHTDVTTPAEALARVDQGEVNVTWLAEPAARRSFIAFEYGAGDNSYGAIFDRHGGLVTSIHDGDLLGCTVEAETCALPEDVVALRSDPAFALQQQRTITAASQLDGVELDQALIALRRTYPELAEVAEGLARVDDRELDLRTYVHAATAARVTAVTFAAGDTVVGAIFYAGTTERAGLVDDLFIDGCTLFVPRA